MASARDQDEAQPKARLFVRGLPFNTTSQELEALFGDVGPVKECFVVKDKGILNVAGLQCIELRLNASLLWVHQNPRIQRALASSSCKC